MNIEIMRNKLYKVNFTWNQPRTLKFVQIGTFDMIDTRKFIIVINEKWFAPLCAG